MGPEGASAPSVADVTRRLAAERSGMAFLLFSNDSQEQVVVLLDPEKSRVVLGRAPDNDIALPWDARVSRVHAELERGGPDWIVGDHGLSRNGTWVNGERVRHRRRLTN